MRRHAIAAAVLGAAALTAGITASGGAQGQGNDRTITVYEKGSAESFKIVDAKPFSRRRHGFPVKFTPGDTAYIRGPLYGDAAHTTRTGGIVARCASTQTARAKNFGKLQFLCDAVMSFADGTLSLHGLTTLDAPTFTVAVIGGTGAYEGARGQVAIVNQSNDDSTDTIHLLGK